MNQSRLSPAALLLLALVPVAAWAGWLGWDQQRDLHPDGSVSGPYEAWQVIGLVLTLIGSVSWAAYRRHSVEAVLGTSVALGAAAWYDWSDDASGLFVVGVGMIGMATLAATTGLCALIGCVRRGA
ncbi:hypothetical protein [Streptomyces sp. NPDC089919]|uniref:hypothetical protein n=1 Tax=Streptomyces sp. NPDC089919 TaxID=3155188 RepID=UPI00341C69B3